MAAGSCACKGRVAIWSSNGKCRGVATRNSNGKCRGVATRNSNGKCRGVATRTLHPEARAFRLYRCEMQEPLSILGRGCWYRTNRGLTRRPWRQFPFPGFRARKFWQCQNAKRFQHFSAGTAGKPWLLDAAVFDSVYVYAYHAASVINGLLFV